jgi:hypothetical protein
MSMREHLLLGSARHDTLRTGCGRTPTLLNGSYTVGSGCAFTEDEYKRLRGIAMMHMCGRCEVAWRKICRHRNEPFTPTARDAERDVP